jgi:hypothetical protein
MMPYISVRVVLRILGRACLQSGHRPAIQVSDDVPRDRKRILVVDGVVIRDARRPTVNIRTAQFLSRHFFARRGLHQRRPAEKDRPLLASR